MKDNYLISLDDLSNVKINKLSIELAHISTLFSDSLILPNIVLRDDITNDRKIIQLMQADSFSITKGESGHIVLIDDKTDELKIIETVLEEVFNVDKESESSQLLLNKSLDSLTDSLTVKDLFGPGELKSRDSNYLVHFNEYKVYTEELLDNLQIIQAMGAIASRLALDCQTISYPIHSDKLNSNVIINSSDETLVKVDGDQLSITFSKDSLDDLFELVRVDDINSLVTYFNDLCNFKNIDGQYVFAKSSTNDYESIYIDKISKDKRALIKDGLADNIKSYKDEELVFSDTKTFDWEVDVIKDKIFKQIDQLEVDKEVFIELSVSEDKSVRENLANQIEEKLKESSLTGKVRVINSYKQGYSWIADYLVDELSELSVDEIKIHFSEFAKTPGQEWTTESGSVPSYVNMDLDNKDKWFDLPIRLLQELYPIDDYLAEHLNINRDSISFHLLEDDGEFKYKVEALDNGQVVAEYEYTPVFSERLYLDEFSTMGLVHPSTSYFKISAGENVLAYEEIMTDLENIWSYYQSDILPKAKEYFDEFKEPIFATLNMDIKVSETDYKLGYRQDLISSIDSFHEDLYFVGLDYFKLTSQEKFDKVLDGPGLILPRIKNEEGPSSIDWSITLPIDRKPFYIKDKERIYLESGNRSMEIASISVYSSSKVLSVDCEGFNLEELLILKKLIEEEASDIPTAYKYFDIIEFKMNKDKIAVDISNKCAKIKADDFKVKLDEIYNYDDYVDSIEQLRKVCDVNVENLTRSYQGRMLHSIELYKGTEGFASSYKLTNMKPTIYINARHHANEVSSTNSSFLLAKLLLTDDNYKKYLDKMNIVIIANENPDGTEIHYELQKDHPEWIFHISRFNSLGKEFSYDYFEEETIHTEAKALAKIYKKWLPDIHIDDHGVPHHEWCQQFSGYTAPAYKGFWLPRALMYGYFWYREEYKENIDFAKKFEEAIADSFENDEYSNALNEDLRDRFKKYANSWLPQMFPAGYVKDLIFYWISFNKESTKKYLSVMFPEVTTIGYTSEVADETATGEYLEKSVLAHLRNNIAMMDVIKEKEIEFRRTFSINDGVIRIRNKRIRT